MPGPFEWLVYQSDTHKHHSPGHHVDCSAYDPEILVLGVLVPHCFPVRKSCIMMSLLIPSAYEQQDHTYLLSYFDTEEEEAGDVWLIVFVFKINQVYNNAYG